MCLCITADANGKAHMTLAHKPTAVQTPEGFDITDYIDGVAGLLGGTANVIMQLSSPPVGHGVAESTVDWGKVKLHPVKRLRTTLAYIAVALEGTEAERAYYRNEVNRSHRSVRSGPDSPVKYNAFDPNLQLWVAACIYWGLADMVEKLHGPLDDDAADGLYHYCSRLGTTLQMPESMWPADRLAFDEYWTRTVATKSIDPVVRDYLYDLVMLGFMPFPIRIFGPVQRFVVTAVLPQKFRDEMQLPWTESDQRRFNRALRVIGAVNRRLPGPVRRFPSNFYLMETRLRIRYNRAIV